MGLPKAALLKQRVELRRQFFEFFRIQSVGPEVQNKNPQQQYGDNYSKKNG
jgi:hypothetical protein